MSSISFFVGSYTIPQDHVKGACGEGIYSCELDLDTGKISLLHVFPFINNPTYLVRDRKHLYACTEIYDRNSQIYGFHIEKDQSLKLISKIETHGSANCHVHIFENKLFSTAYGSGNMDIYSIDDGKLTPQTLIQYHGSGPNMSRQLSAHAHQAISSPDNRWLYVCDLGSDKIWCHSHRKDYNQTAGFTMTPPGSGPRHAAFHPSLPYLYVVAEMTAYLLVYKYEARDGTLELVEDVYTLPEEFDGLRSSAAIRVHSSGKAVYISNRQHNSIAIYAINNSTPLKLISRIPSGGKEPRDIQISPNGKFLLITNQNENNITVYKLNPEDGSPISDIIHVFECKTPVCIEF